MSNPPHDYDGTISGCCAAPIKVHEQVIEQDFHVNYFTSCTKCGFVCTAFKGSKEELKKYKADVKEQAPDPSKPFTEEDLRQIGEAKGREKPKAHEKRAAEHFAEQDGSK